MTTRTTTRGHALLGTLAGSMLIDAVEVSVVLVALPDAAAALRLSPGAVQWLMSAFAAGFAAALLLGPRLTARHGVRTPYVAALLVFAAASVVGGLSGDPAVVVATRAVKGACAGFTAPAGLAVLGTVFPPGPERRRAVSVYSLFGAAGFSAGLLLSGVLTGAGWQWVLLAPAPVALVLAVLAARLLPAGRAPAAPAERHRTPWRAAVCAAMWNGAFLGLLVVTTFVLRVRFGWAPWQVAVGLLPACLPVALAARLTGRVVARFGTTLPVVLGSAIGVAGFLHCLTGPWSRSYLTGVLPVLLLVGVGLALAFGPLNAQAASTGPAAVARYQCAVQCGAVAVLTPAAALLDGGAADSRRAVLVAGAAAVLACAAAVAGHLLNRPQKTVEMEV